GEINPIRCKSLVEKLIRKRSICIYYWFPSNRRLHLLNELIEAIGIIGRNSAGSKWLTIDNRGQIPFLGFQLRDEVVSLLCGIGTWNKEMIEANIHAGPQRISYMVLSGVVFAVLTLANFDIDKMDLAKFESPIIDIAVEP